MTMSGNVRTLTLAGISMLALVPTGALAQTTSPREAAPPAAGLNDIVVTAQRRDVNLQDASLSVSAIDAETLAEANVTEITGLNGLVPGLVVARSGGGERMISIRGIGSETPENTNTQPGVSYHVDGVYIFNSIAANAAFIDVAQVEVLRGPQGTTFGQGSTGGTINVVTNQPQLNRFGGAVQAGYGNYNYTTGTASVNVPLGRNFALRGSVQHVSHDGYAHATGVPGCDEYELDTQDELGWKVALLWQPADNFSLTLNTVQYSSDTHAPAQKNVLDPQDDPRILTQDYPGRSQIDTGLYYGVARLELGGAVIKSITSYQTLDSIQAWDADGLTGDLFHDLTYSPVSFTGTRYDHVPLWQTDNESWTQEINAGSTGTGPFNWIVGGVYLHSKNYQYIVEYRADDDDFLRAALPVDTPFDDPRVAALTYASLQTVEREAYAAYFELTYAITDALSITGGLRYNHDEYSGVSASNTDIVTSGSYLQPVAVPGLSSHEWTGKAAVTYDLAPENIVYFSYTRGYKPGGLNGTAAGAAPALLGFENGTMPTYLPEQVDSFEIGTKNRFLGNRLQLNASAFFYDYRNLQFLQEDAVPYGEGTSNAPRAQIFGAELEGSWLIDDHWAIDGSASFLHGEFTRDYYALDPVNASDAQIAAGYPDYLFWTNFYAAALARDAARQNINGNDVPKMPNVQGSASLRHMNRIGAGAFTAKAQYVYRGQYQYRLFNDSVYDRTPAYSQVNLFFSYRPDVTDVTFSLTVTNLLDENGINSRFSDPYGSAQVSDTFIAPRQVIGSLAYRF